jgi:acyl-coenzyme A synthetase/AMP-(fatty) acid ligase
VREVDAGSPQGDSPATAGGPGLPSPGGPIEAGGWRFAGREDSLVKIRGRWVNLVELEEKLSSGSAGIAEAAAVCVPDSDGVDAVALFFVASDDAAADAALSACADTLPHYQRPRWLHAVEALPRTPTGKLLRRKLQELHRTLD